MIHYLYAMVDQTDNSYDYNSDSFCTDDLETVQIWFNCGIKEVAVLDPLSLAQISTYDKEDFENIMREVQNDT